MTTLEDQVVQQAGGHVGGGGGGARALVGHQPQ